MDYQAAGKRIKDARRWLGMTQEELAEAAEVSTSYIGHIERGTRKMSVETLERLCVELNISADYVMGLS